MSDAWAAVSWNARTPNLERVWAESGTRLVQDRWSEHCAGATQHNENWLGFAWTDPRPRPPPAPLRLRRPTRITRTQPHAHRHRCHQTGFLGVGGGSARYIPSTAVPLGAWRPNRRSPTVHKVNEIPRSPCSPDSVSAAFVRSICSEMAPHWGSRRCDQHDHLPSQPAKDTESRTNRLAGGIGDATTRRDRRLSSRHYAPKCPLTCTNTIPRRRGTVRRARIANVEYPPRFKCGASIWRLSRASKAADQGYRALTRKQALRVRGGRAGRCGSRTAGSEKRSSKPNSWTRTACGSH